MIEQLKEAQRILAEAHYSGALDTDAILECVQEVIDELEGERAAYLAECDEALFGKASERDGSAWRQKKEGKT